MNRKSLPTPYRIEWTDGSGLSRTRWVASRQIVMHIAQAIELNVRQIAVAREIPIEHSWDSDPGTVYSIEYEIDDAAANGGRAKRSAPIPTNRLSEAKKLAAWFSEYIPRVHNVMLLKSLPIPTPKPEEE